MDKMYLGDGVYVSHNPAVAELVLTTENGIEVTNRIVLDLDTYRNLLAFAARAAQKTRTKPTAKDIADIIGDLR